MSATYTPHVGDQLVVQTAFSIDKGSERTTPQFNKGDVLDPAAHGVSLFTVRELLRLGRLKLERPTRKEEETQNKDPSNPKAPPAQKKKPSRSTQTAPAAE